jgi:hypothetical protein
MVSCKMKHTIATLLAVTLVGIIPCGQARDLDDISIQVIGLEEIPEEALERIPLPGPGMGGLTDIREGFILNRPVFPGVSANTTPEIGGGLDSVNGGGGAVPTPPSAGGGPNPQ